MSPTLVAVIAAVLLIATARPRPTTRPLDTSAPVDRSTGPSAVRLARTRRRVPRDEAADVARWCESLARAVRGGDTLPVALRTTDTPTGHDEFIDEIIREIDRTGRLDLPARNVPTDLALALAVISAALVHGGPAAEPLDRAAGVLRSRSAEHADRQVQSAQARLSARVMTTLPVAMLMLLLVGSASVRAAVASPAGICLVAIGAALNLIGGQWMRRIIRASAR